MERPTTVSILGWGWLVVGGLGVLWYLASLGMFINFMMTSPEWISGDPMYVWVGGGSTVVQCLAAGLGAVAGWYLLQGRSWARTALEILSWLAVAEFALGVLVATVGMVGTGAMVIIGIVAVFASGVLTLPFAASVYFLRSAEVREFVRYEE